MSLTFSPVCRFAGHCCDIHQIFCFTLITSI